jgi:hypothetical protein
MDLKHIKIGMNVFVGKKASQYYGEEGRVLSVFSDYGLNSATVSIRLMLDDGTVVGGFSADEISA